MNAIIIYDEDDLAERAKTLLKHASQRANEVMRWEIKLWRFDVLLHLPTAGRTLTDALGAHLIVLAIRSQEDITPWLLDWLETWAQHRQVQDAALAVFNGEEGGMLSTTAPPGLYEFAIRHGLHFIFGDVTPSFGEPTVFTHNLHKRELVLTPTLRHILEQPASGSGIFPRYAAYLKVTM